MSNPYLSKIGARTVQVSRAGVAQFNRTWPCSELRSTRSYWFTFEANGDLVDTDLPEQDDGSAALAMTQDCQAWLFEDIVPEWAQI
jgi:hypothetical protein